MNNYFRRILGVSLIFCLAWSFPTIAAEPEAAAAADAARTPDAAPAEKAPAPAVAKDEKTFTGEALELKNTMEELFEASRHVNDKGPEKEKSRAKIENALDWDRVAKDCLGAERYKKLSAANKEKLRSLLHQVIVKTAFTRLDTFWNGTKVTFRKITVKDGNGIVDNKFQVGKDAFDLVYYLYKRDNHWWIYDISFEDLRYSENINEQLEAFLKEKSFAALLDKLQKRLDEIQAGNVKDNIVPKPKPKKS